jgi:hypothetical protein
MKTESEIRELRNALENFNHEGVHDREILALTWVLSEYPPPPVERPQPPAPDPNIAQPMFPGDFPVRSFPRQNVRLEENE